MANNAPGIDVPFARTVTYNAAPATALLALFVTLGIELFVPQRRICSPSLTGRKRTNVIWISRAVLFEFLIETSLVSAHLYIRQDISASSDRLFYCLCSLLTWSCICWSLGEASEPYKLPYIAFWSISGSADIAILSLLGLRSARTRSWSLLQAILVLARVALTLVAIICSFAGRDSRESPKIDEETQALLDPNNSETPARSYSEATLADQAADEEVDDSASNADSDEDEKEIKELQEKRLSEQGGWVGYLSGFLTFLPHLLPYKDRYTQYWLLVMIVCVLVERVLMVMIPRQLGAITERLGQGGLNGQPPWVELLTWGFLQFPIATGQNMLKYLARTRISQFAYARLKAAAFSHVMSLSMDYHSFKSSGKLTKAIEQGTDLTSIVENVFITVPTFIDLIIAAIYLTIAFDRFMGLIVIATMIGYIVISVKKNAVTSKMERLHSEKTRVESEVLFDSVSNWQTVAYHNRRAFEEDRYAVADCILDAGLLTAAVLATYRVATGASPLSNFVFLIMYWVSVREPMSMIAFTFHETAAHLINAEWLFQLLQTKATIQDKPGAKHLSITQGRVVFDDVSFSYTPERQILKGLSFVAEPGSTVALVGQTGGGKSTILKMLYRFYDVTSGSITIDDQDVRDITLDSLRESLGIVPQDPCVFDQTIMQNLIYARPEATMDEVHAACQAAQIHEQILRFPQGYQTRIGERGVRLSGGELQRLAIARVMLRQPSIVILDEATSAVDSATEVSVQKALKILSKGRTVFVVAHRLSTIVKADQILMLDGGKIVEKGTHDELLRKNGAYHNLWHMQTVVEDA